MCAPSGRNWLVGIALGVMGAIVVLPPTAQAQEGGPVDAAEPTAQQRGGIEAITVTAEKRETLLQETPISITALGAADLDRFSVERLDELSEFVPSLRIGRDVRGAQTQISLRGMNPNDSALTHQARVGIYLDGIYVGNQTGLLFDIDDLNRIEVLRGPQGTLWGRNSLGGAINVISQKPRPDWGGKLKLAWGQDNKLEARGTLNIPLIRERLMGRISFARTYQEGLYSNLNKQEDDFADDDGLVVRGSLRWLVADTLTADYVFERATSEEVARPWRLFRVLDEDARPCFTFYFPACAQDEFGDDVLTNAAANGGRDGATGSDRNTARNDTWFHGLTFTWDLTPNLTIKSLSGWRKVRTATDADVDGIVGVLVQGDSRFFQQQFSQEINAVGTLLDGRVDYAFGATWFNEDIKSDQRLATYDFLDDCPGGVSVGASNCPFFVPLGGGAFFNIPLNINSRPVSDGTNYSWGVYTQWTAHMTEKLSLTAGLRYSHERKDIMQTSCAYPPGASFDLSECIPGSGIQDTSSLSLRFDNWSPLFRAEYQWTDTLMMYALWTRGYQAGAFNPRPPPATPRTSRSFDEEKLNSWEVGFKSQWFDQRMQLNASGYYNDFEDQQVSQFDATNVGQAIVSNAGNSRVRGFEVEIRAVPLPALDLFLGYSWVHADFIDFKEDVDRNGDGDFDDPGELNFNNADAHTFAGFPTRMLNGGARYQLPEVPFGAPYLSATFSRMGEIDWSANRVDNSGMRGDRYTRYDLRLGIDNLLGREGLWMALVGKNISDAEYRVNGINLLSIGWLGGNFAEPRSFWLEMGFAWGGER